MNLTEIRNSYPQYNDLTDEQLVGGLHQKYYPDLDVKDFHERISYRPAKLTPGRAWGALMEGGKDVA